LQPVLHHRYGARRREWITRRSRTGPRAESFAISCREGTMRKREGRGGRCKLETRYMLIAPRRTLRTAARHCGASHRVAGLVVWKEAACTVQPQDADHDPGRDDLKGPKRRIDAAEELLLLLDAQLPGVARTRVRVRRAGDDAIVSQYLHCLAMSPLLRRKAHRQLPSKHPQPLCSHRV